MLLLGVRPAQLRNVNNESDSGRRNITESDKGCVVTIGNFDGVHLGHQAILAAVKSQATKDGVDSMLRGLSRSQKNSSMSLAPCATHPVC